MYLLTYKSDLLDRRIVDTYADLMLHLDFLVDCKTDYLLDKIFLFEPADITDAVKAEVENKKAS